MTSREVICTDICIIFAIGQPSNLQKMLFRPSRALSIQQNFRESSTIVVKNCFLIGDKQACTQIHNFHHFPDSQWTKNYFFLANSPYFSSFPPLCKSGPSQKASNVRLVSLLQHPEYEQLKNKLEIKAQSALDCACLHILVNDQLKVSQALLDLNAVSLYSITTKSLKELEDRGLLIFGKYNVQVEKVLRTNFTSLVADSCVKKKDLERELFTRQGPGNTPDREFLLKRQLIGFFLLKGLQDSHLRLPIEALNRLASILYAGKFTKKEDKAILAWVDQNGPNKWTDLAWSLNRHYIHGPTSVMNRYQVLKDKIERKEKGTRSYSDIDEDTELLTEVLKQDPQALSKMTTGVAWLEVADRLNRPRDELYRDWTSRILPTLRRHLAGTLQHDVREDLIKEVARRHWQYCSDVEFPTLVTMPEFKGHTPTSLSRMYKDLVEIVVTKQKKKGVMVSRREVTVMQVQEGWDATTKSGKQLKKIEWEEELVSAYNELAKDLGLEHPDL